jgi:hypothetical protein
MDQPTEKQRVMACGLTESEADCWEQTAKAAGAFFDLPKLHPMDDHEVAQAIHIIQHKLLSRPAYRQYLKGRDDHPAPAKEAPKSEPKK